MWNSPPVKDMFGYIFIGLQEKSEDVASLEDLWLRLEVFCFCLKFEIIFFKKKQNLLWLVFLFCRFLTWNPKD